MTQRVPDLWVEKLARGELSATEAAAVRAALGDEADERLRAIAQDDAAVLARLPAAAVAATVRRRLDAVAPTPRAMPSWWIPATALAAASLAIWCAVRSGPGEGPLPVDDGGGMIVDPAADPGIEDPVRIKGDAVLAIDRLTPSGAERLVAGAGVRAGDRLQLQYRAGAAEHGAIVSIDGAGVTTLHFPAELGAPSRLASGGMVALDHSYELDAAPGFERFFLVTAPVGVRFDVGVVMAAAERLAAGGDAERGALGLPVGYEQTAVSLAKR